MLTNLIFVVVPVALLAALAVYVSRAWPMPLPPVGVFDRSDIVITAGVIVVFPMLGSLLPPWGAALVFAAIIINAWFDMGWRLCPRSGLRILAAVGVVTASLVMQARGWSYAWAFNDVLLAVTVVSIVAVWVQMGMTLRHVTALAAFLTVYDLISTHLTSLTMHLMEGLLDGPLPFTFVIEVHGQHFQLGFGDVLVVCALAAGAYAAHPPRIALACGAAAIGGLAGALWFAVTHPESYVAVMTFVGPAALVASLAAAAAAAAAAAGPGRRPDRSPLPA